MKKSVFLLVLTILLFFSNNAFCNTNEEFLQNLSSCNYHIDINDNGIFMILGWSNRRCYYKEVGYKEELSCSFKILELEDLINIMRNENYYYTKGLKNLKGAQKYVKSPNYCSITKSK